MALHMLIVRFSKLQAQELSSSCPMSKHKQEIHTQCNSEPLHPKVLIVSLVSKHLGLAGTGASKDLQMLSLQ